MTKELKNAIFNLLSAGEKVNLYYAGYEMIWGDDISSNAKIKEMLSDWILDEWDPFIQTSDRHLHSHDIHFTRDEDELLMEITYYDYDGEIDDCYLKLNRKDLENYTELIKELDKLVGIDGDYEDEIAYIFSYEEGVFHSFSVHVYQSNTWTEVHLTAKSVKHLKKVIKQKIDNLPHYIDLGENKLYVLSEDYDGKLDVSISCSEILDLCDVEEYLDEEED